MVNTITTRISLEGGDELLKQLKELGKAGQQSLNQISEAAGDVGFDELGKAGGSAAEGIAKAGEASQTTAGELDNVKGSADQASNSMSNLSLETAKTATEIAKNVAEIAKLGVEIGLAVTKHDSLFKIMVKLATSSSTTAQAVKALEVVLGTTAAAVGIAALAITGGVLALEALGKAAAAAAGPYEKLNHDLQMLSQSSGQSAESLQRGEALFGQIGLSAEAFRGTVSKIAAELGKLDVSGELQKSADSIVDANKKVLEAEKAVIEQRLEGRQVFLIGDDDRLGQRVADLRRLQQIQAELNTEVNKAKELEDALLAARQKAAEAAANSLSKVLEQVKAIEAGQTGITFDSLVTAETKIKAFAISMKQAEDAGQNAGAVLVKFIAAADKASAIQIGKQFGLDEEQVDRIQRLGGHLQTVDEIWKRIQGAGVLIPPGSAAAFEKMRTDIQATERAWTRLEQAWQSSILGRLAATVIPSLEQIKQGAINTAAGIIEAFNRIPNTVMAFWQLWANGIEALMRDVAAAGLGAAASIAEGFAKITFGDLSAKFTEVAQGLRATQQGLSQSADEFRAKGLAAWNAVGQSAAQGAAQVTQAAGTITTAMQQMGQGAAGLQAQANILQQVGGDALTAAQKFDQLRNAVSAMAGGPVTVEAYRLALQAMNGDAAKATQLINELQGTAQRVGQAAPAVQQVGTALQAVGSEAEKTTQSLNRVQTTTTAWDAVTGAINTAWEALKRFVGLSSSGGGGGAPAPKMARGGLLGGRGSGTSDSNLAWVSRGEYIINAAAVRHFGSSFFAALNAKKRPAGASSRLGRYAGGGPIDDFSDLLNKLGGEVQGIYSVIDAIRNLRIDDTIEQIQRTVEVLARSIGSNARGGLLGGRGTGTSDSNLAWVSRGEHIMPARAVAQPGVLAFLEALRRSGGDLGRVLNGLGRFAMGGPVAMPAFANGGLGGMSHVTIAFPGLPAISGLRASSDVVSELQRAAALAQVRSGGRKPSRYT